MKISILSHFYSFIAITLTMLLAIAGCAALQPDPQLQADQKESMLAAAGFKMLPAETPEKLARAQSLPQLKVKYFTARDGSVRYWMADAQFCQCVYLGSESNYQKFKELDFQARLASEQRESAELQMEAAQQEQMEMMDPMLVGPVWLY